MKMKGTFLFVNKGQDSGTLSRSQKAEEAAILSHSQSRRRRAERRGPRPTQPWEQNSSVFHVQSVASTSPAVSINGIGTRETREVSRSSTRLTISYPSFNASDPFFSTVAHVDAGNHAFLRMALSSATRPVFLAEAFAPPAVRATRRVMRHDAILDARLQQCVSDRLVMYSTLTYGSCLASWLLRGGHGRADTHHFLDEAIHALRQRLSHHDQATSDNWLALSIYSLAATELWKGTPEMWKTTSDLVEDESAREHLLACKTHLTAALGLVHNSGGWANFDPYILDSFILVDKYLGIALRQPSMIPLSWDPGAMSELHREVVGEQGGFLARLGVNLLKEPMMEGLRSILVDLVQYCRAAAAAWASPIHPNLPLETWLFRRIQAITYRLHEHLRQPLTFVERVICLASVLFISNCMEDKGASISAARLAPQLKNMIYEAKCQQTLRQGLLSWALTMGAMIAAEFPERGWFMRQARRYANGQSCACLEADLETYLYLKQSGQLSNLIYL